MVILSPEINMGNIFAENKYCILYHQTYLATQYLYLIKKMHLIYHGFHNLPLYYLPVLKPTRLLL